MTPAEFLKQKEQQKQIEVKEEVKISNALIEAFVRKNNLVALKTLFYIAKGNLKLSDTIVKIVIDTKSLCDYCNISMKTLQNNIVKMQETSIKFVYDNDIVEYISTIPRARFITGKNKLEIDIYPQVLKLIAEVKNKYTVIEPENLMKLKSKHSIRMLMLLEYINTFSKNAAKRKTYTLFELNKMFGTEYPRMAEFERSILKPAKEELDSISKLSFQYEINYEAQPKGRPRAVGATIDLVNNTPQGKLF